MEHIGMCLSPDKKFGGLWSYLLETNEIEENLCTCKDATNVMGL